MKLYLRCVWANKFTLAGYIWVVITVGILRSADPHCMLIYYPGIFFLQITNFGTETMTYYQRATVNIQRYGLLRASHGMRAQNAYCRKTGIEMAKRDYLRNH